ncbi:MULTISPECIES: hypothetical protein [Bacillus]|uniref:hypothetical protein n=1 Tax=Bacillus TaxID=1386 RepID=UPI000BB94CE6|nr:MULTISPECIES: hypothetical protein [Bacillus]
MFDPTVFDNLKVVIEGDIYDLDLDGEVRVVNREDIVDLANMSRLFRMQVTVDNILTASIDLRTDLESLTAELLHEKVKDLNKPGCRVTVSFKQKLIDIPSWESKLNGIWGTQWPYSHRIQYTHGQEIEKTLTTIMKINRPIYEENIDDMRNLITYIVKTLK